MKTLSPEDLTKLKDFTSAFRTFKADKFLDWALYNAGAQFQIEPIGYNGGWRIKRIDPAAITVSHRIEYITPTFKEAVWKAAVKLYGIYSDGSV